MPGIVGCIAVREVKRAYKARLQDHIHKQRPNMMVRVAVQDTRRRNGLKRTEGMHNVELFSEGLDEFVLEGQRVTRL